MDMAAFGTAKNASKWHGVFPASLCRRLGGFSFGAMAADAEVGGRRQPQAERRREQAETARRGFLGLLPQFRGAAGGRVRPPLKRRRSCVGMALYILCHICIEFFMFFLVSLLCKRPLSAVAYINKKCRKSSV